MGKGWEGVINHYHLRATRTQTGSGGLGKDAIYCCAFWGPLRMWNGQLFAGGRPSLTHSHGR